MRRPSLDRIIALGLSASVVVGCARYEMVPDYLTPECRNRVAPRSAMSVDTVSVDSAMSGIVTGQVRSEYEPGGMSATVVMIESDPRRAVTTDTSGRFSFADVPAGRYRFSARRLGYLPASDSIRVVPGRGVHVRVDLRPLMNDGPCSGFGAVRVRKPWWKVW